MIFTETPLKGAFVVEQEPFSDERGFFARAYCRDELASIGADYDFVQANMSGNVSAGTLRGLHYQDETAPEAKLLRCLRGAVYDVIVDMRPGSPTRYQWFGVELNAETRKAILADYAAGKTRVVVNVAVLTEGWDHPPTSCVVLLRPSSYKSTMIQMIGRGLRTVDPEEHPGLVKTDCVVLDFGTSSLIHGTLEQDVDLDGKIGTGEAPTKTCPACEAEIPLAATECPLCGEVLLPDEGETGADAAPLSGFVMTEIDLLKRSSFAWVDLFGTDDALMATGFSAWGGIFWMDGVWYAIGGAKGERPRLLGVGERTVCLAQADDWLNTHESDESAFKTRGWLRQPPTDKQLKYLPPECRHDFGLTRYRASALMTFGFNKRAIQAAVNAVAGSERRAA